MWLITFITCLVESCTYIFAQEEMSQPEQKKTKTGEVAQESSHEEARLKEVVDRAVQGRDVSALLVSVNGSKVEPCTPVVGRIVSLTSGQGAPPPALHLACHCGDLAAVRRLLEASAKTEMGCFLTCFVVAGSRASRIFGCDRRAS